MVAKVRTYPTPGTHADTVLAYVQKNEGTTMNGIIVGLKMNPATARKAMAGLVEAGLVLDRPDAAQHHHYTAKNPA